MNRAIRAFQRPLLATALALGAVSLLTVCADVSAPDRPHPGRVAFATTMSSASAAALGSSSTVIDNVHIVIRSLDGTIVFDQIVVFPAGADEVAIAAEIQVHGDAERFRATIQLRSGETVLFEGTQDLDVRPGEQSGPPSEVPVTYVGTGANAASLAISPGEVTLTANGSSQFNATVRDGGGNIIQNVPLGWSSSNDDVATVSGTGVVTAKSVRGTAVISATTFGGIGGSSRALVVLPPSQLRVVSGNGQTARVGDALPVAFVVELLASDGLGIANVPVSFSATGTGASITPTAATTDANGRASVAATLGTVAGPFSFAAAAAGFSASINATGIPGDANRIAITSGNTQGALTGTALPLPLSVRVTDEFGNPGAGRQVNWSVVTAGSLASASSTTNASGIATNTYTLPVVAGENVVSATLPTGGGVSFTATALPRPPAALTVTSGTPQTGITGAAAQPLVVRVTDALNQVVTNATIAWTVTGSATVGAPTSTTSANGFATVSAKFATTPGTATVTATAVGGATATFTLITTVGPPAAIEIVAGNNQTGSPGNAVPIAPSVRVTDAFANPIAGVNVTFGGATGGGSVTGGVQVTTAAGIAAVGSWILGGFAPTQTLTATAGPLNVVFNATTSVGPGSVSSLSSAYGSGQVATAFQPLQPFQAQALDGSEAPVAGATIQFTVLSGSILPTVFSTNTDTMGIATFAATSGAAGPSIVQACVLPGCTITTTFTVTTITSGSIWIGGTSSDWFTASNWSTGIVPGAASNVYISASTTFFPILTGNTFMNEFFMAPGSLLSISTFEMQIGSKITTTGATVIGSGTFRTTAANAPIAGQVPALILDGTLSATGPTFVNGSVTIEGGGRLDVGAATIQVNGALFVDGAGRLTMTNSAGVLLVNGAATFQGQDMGDVELTAGLLEVRGNFIATVYNQAFRAAGTHVTRFSGSAAQTIDFFVPGGAFSRFQNLEITNTSTAGVSLNTNTFAQGTLLQGGRLTVGLSRSLTINGATTLQSGSTTNAGGGALALIGGCTNLGGAANGFTC